MEREVWELVARQHGVVSRGQLAALGLSRSALENLVRRGMLHRVGRSVYAVGRPELTTEGRWMAAVLAGGRRSLLSHRSAGALWGLCTEGPLIDVTLAPERRLRRPGIAAHRRAIPAADRAEHRRVPVTSPALTLIDIAAGESRRVVERGIAEADKRDLIGPDGLRAALVRHPGRPGVAELRRILDRATFRLTDSELERRFLPLASGAGLPLPETGRRIAGFKVDFVWPALGLIVETDGLRYHRTATQQARDRLRDQRHAARGWTTLRFTHAQVRYEPAHVVETLRAVARHRVVTAARQRVQQ